MLSQWFFSCLASGWEQCQNSGGTREGWRARFQLGKSAISPLLSLEPLSNVRHVSCIQLCKDCTSRLPFLSRLSVAEPNEGTVCFSSFTGSSEGPILLLDGFRERMCRCDDCLVGIPRTTLMSLSLQCYMSRVFRNSTRRRDVSIWLILKMTLRRSQRRISRKRRMNESRMRTR